MQGMRILESDKVIFPSPHCIEKIFNGHKSHFLHLKVFFLTVRYDSYLKTSMSFAEMSDFFLPMESGGIYRPQS